MTMLSTKSKIQLLTVLLNDIKNDVSQYSNGIQYESLSVFEGDGKPLLTLLDNNRSEIYLSFNEKGGLEANTGDESKDKTIERKYKINWLLKSLSIVIATLALTFTTVSCKKPSDDPNPVNPINSNNPVDTTTNNGNGNGTDTTSNNGNINKPAFKKVLYEVKSNGISQSFNLDVDGDNINIISITGQSDNVTINHSRLNVTVNVPNKVYAGTETLSITISNNIDTVSANVRVNIGSSNQIETYNILSSYFNRSLTLITTSGHFNGTLYINTNGDINTSEPQAPGTKGFFGGTSESGTFFINSSGYMGVTSGTYSIGFTVTISSGVLILTKNDGIEYKFN
jgi:hypothetical protein